MAKYGISIAMAKTPEIPSETPLAIRIISEATTTTRGAMYPSARALNPSDCFISTLTFSPTMKFSVGFEITITFSADSEAVQEPRAWQLAHADLLVIITRTPFRVTSSTRPRCSMEFDDIFCAFRNRCKNTFLSLFLCWGDVIIYNLEQIQINCSAIY